MNPDPANLTATLPPLKNGGVILAVTFLDGLEENVMVRQLGLQHMPDYAAAQGDEARMCQIVTGKDAAWFCSLSIESQEQILDLADQLNTEHCLRWCQRRLAANRQFAPVLPKTLAKDA